MLLPIRSARPVSARPVSALALACSALMILAAAPASAAQSEATVATSSPKCATFLIGSDQSYILARMIDKVAAPAEDSPLHGDFSHTGLLKIEVGPKGKGKLITIEILKIGKSSGDTVPDYLNACGE